MRWEAQLVSVTVAAWLAASACSSSTQIGEERHVDVSASGGSGQGGTDAGAGGQGTGGFLATGGSAATGGFLATGGFTTTGGFTATGGLAATGGFIDPREPRRDAGLQRCTGCLIQLSTTQSNAFHTINGAPLTVTAAIGDHVVFGLGNAGAGRIAFSGDGNVLFREGQCPLWQWLGATGDAYPRVLCIGAKFPCDGETQPRAGDVNGLHAYPGQLDYGGLTLPAEYDGDPVALRAAYDVVAYFGVIDHATGSWRDNPADADTLEAFVRSRGGGLYLVGEYFGAGSTAQHIASLNTLARPWSIEFEELSLAWAQTSAEATLSCLPKDPREGELR